VTEVHWPAGCDNTERTALSLTSHRPDRFAVYSNDVYGWAFRILGHHHDALDVVQEVFLRWHQQCRKDEPEQERGWLRRVTINRAIDLYRRSSARKTHLRDAAAGQTTSTAPQVAIDRDRLIAALDALSDAQRFVLTAKTFDDATFANIAKDLGVSESTAKTHFVRAVRNVRDSLEELR
jgi:RNA polymerase sigma-70 factor (ECF subfamily)